MSAPVPDEATLAEDFTHDATTFTVEWIAKGWGFGIFSFWHDDGVLVVDNEAMSRRFVKLTLELMIGQRPREEWPDLLQKHGSIDELLDAATPLWPHAGWGAPE